MLARLLLSEVTMTTQEGGTLLDRVLSNGAVLINTKLLEQQSKN